MKMKNWIAFTMLLPLSAQALPALAVPDAAPTRGQDAQPKAAPKATVKAAPKPASDEAGAPEEQGSIEGTWRMVSFRYGGKGAPLQKVQAGRVMLKHITPGHFTWVDYAAKTKAVTRMAGGTFTLDGGAYQETVEYGSGEDITALLGKGQVFNDTITSQRWHHKGKLSIGLEIEEEWERVQ